MFGGIALGWEEEKIANIHGRPILGGIHVKTSTMGHKISLLWSNNKKNLYQI